MDTQEYKDRILAIKAKANREIELEMIAFAKANNPYKVGDTFEDHMGAIKIEAMKVVGYTSTEESLPSMKYLGSPLEKDGTVSVKYPARWAYQLNDIKAKK